MKLGVFMLWTEMRAPHPAAPRGVEASDATSARSSVDAHARFGLGAPFEHDDVLPESLRIGASVRPSTVEAVEVAPSKKARASRVRKLPDAQKLAEVVSTVRAKRARSKVEEGRSTARPRSSSKSLHPR